MRIAITGANSSVGRNLLSHIADNPDLEAVAGVRSASAFSTLPASDRITPRVISYDDEADLAAAFAGSQVVVHLAGILIETRHSRYESANVAATAAVVRAAREAGVGLLVFTSVIGADRQASNRYFHTKGEAEALVAESGLAACIIRTPLLLGPGTAGADAILWSASNAKTRLLSGGNYTMHPLDVDDLSQAILNQCARQQTGAETFELVGPDAILYRDLISTVARLQGRNIEIGTMPVWLAKLGAGISSKLKGGGITPTVIDVITIDEHVPANAADKLGITLTPLQTTLQKILDAKEK